MSLLLLEQCLPLRFIIFYLWVTNKNGVRFSTASLFLNIDADVLINVLKWTNFVHMQWRTCVIRIDNDVSVCIKLKEWEANSCVIMSNKTNAMFKKHQWLYQSRAFRCLHEH